MSPNAVGLHVDDGDRGPSIRTASGGRFHLLDPRPDDFKPEDIAHALAHLCRFTGHVRRFYSVAQHCVIVSKIVPPELAMAGLMHDASEAFIGDISRPLKDALDERAPGVVRDIEDSIHAAIAERFGFDFPHHPLVKDADNVALATEFRDLLPEGHDLHGLPDPLPDRLLPWSADAAKSLWLFRFRELGGVL